MLSIKNISLSLLISNGLYYLILFIFLITSRHIFTNQSINLFPTLNLPTKTMVNRWAPLFPVPLGIARMI